MLVTICCHPRAERWRRDRSWDRVLRTRLRESGNWDWNVEQFAKFRRVVVLEGGRSDRSINQVLNLQRMQLADEVAADGDDRVILVVQLDAEVSVY